MRQTFRILTFSLLTMLMACGESNHTTATTPVTDPLIGRWEVISIGQKTIPHKITPFWIIDNEHVTVTDHSTGEQISCNAYKIERSISPPRLIMNIEGEKDRIGWFRFKDNELQLLFTINTGEPPKSWEEGDILRLRPVPKE